MKGKFSFLLLITSIFLSACLIKSFQPFYLVDDIRSDDRLVGTWMDQDSSVWNFQKAKVEDPGFFEKKKPQNPYYLLSYTEDDGDISRFQVTLFAIDDQLYLDLFPDYETLTGHDLFSMHTLPVHSLAKLEILDDRHIDFKWFNEEWLGELIHEGKTQISHEKLYSPEDEEEDASIVLTASTIELQAFIRSFGKDPAAFDCEDKYSGDMFCRQLLRVH